MDHMNPMIPEPVKVEDQIVLSRDAQLRLGASARAAVIVDVNKSRRTFEIEILIPNQPQCECLNAKRHRFNKTTLEHVCTDKYGEARAGFHRTNVKPERYTVHRNGFWLMQKFED